MWSDFFAFARTQGGPVHVRAAARASGLSPSSLRRRAEREGWWQPTRDVIAPPGTPRTGETRALAALAHVDGAFPDRSRPAALTRWSAAAAYGVHRAWPSAVAVAVGADRRLQPGPQLTVVRTRGLTPQDVQTLRASPVRVVRAPLVVRDLAAVTGVERLTTLVIDLVQQRHLDLDALADLLRDGRRFVGRAKVREVVVRLADNGRTDSRAELDARSRLEAAGIGLDPGQVPVRCADGRTIHLDLGIAALRFGIEVDSMLAHATRAQLRRDVRRANALTRLPEGWRVLRMTVEDLDADWPQFLALVEAVLAEQRERLGRPALRGVVAEAR